MIIVIIIIGEINLILIKFKGKRLDSQNIKIKVSTRIINPAEIIIIINLITALIIGYNNRKPILPK